MKGLKIIMMISHLILNSKGKDVLVWRCSAGLANDKGYIFNQKCLLFPKNQYQL
jgi:hypothetical protein